MVNAMTNTDDCYPRENAQHVGNSNIKSDVFIWFLFLCIFCYRHKEAQQNRGQQLSKQKTIVNLK